MAPIDHAILLLYLFLTCGIAAFFSGKQKSLKDYFLGDRNIPWFAAAFSGIATIVSATSFLGGPGMAFSQNLEFLQYRLALPLALGLICGLILPKFFRLQVYSIYEYLEHRFDARVRLTASGLFLMLKMAYLAICIYAPSLVLARLLDLPMVTIVVVVGLVTAIYTMQGGIKAVIWTDTLQLGIFLGAIVFVIVVVSRNVPDGLAGILQIAGDNGRLDYFNFSWSLTEPYTFLGGLLGGTVFTLSQFGVDQAEVQRYLTTANIRQSNIAMISSMLAATAVGFALFLIGAALFAFYHTHPGKLTAEIGPNDIFPKFILEELPHGVKGLLIAAILAATMSTISSVLNSMAAVALNDIWPRLHARPPGVKAGRVCTVAFGAAGTLLACMGDQFGNILEASILIGNLFGGSLVGTFLLGMLVRRATARGAFLGMLSGFASAVCLWQLTPIAPLWYGFFSLLVVLSIGILVSLADDPPTAGRLRDLARDGDRD